MMKINKGLINSGQSWHKVGNTLVKRNISIIHKSLAEGIEDGQMQNFWIK